MKYTSVPSNSTTRPQPARGGPIGGGLTGLLVRKEYRLVRIVPFKAEKVFHLSGGYTAKTYMDVI